MMNMMKNTAGTSRFIRAGHSCLGVVTPAGLTLTTGDGNNSLLWSRMANSNAGSHHTWTPWGNGKPTAALPGFNGERIDPVSGAYHLGNGYRAYNPVLRRFNCPDSMSPFSAGGINPYSYCAGDPVNHTDPSGHLSWSGIAGIVLGVIGVVSAAVTAGASIAAAGGVIAALSSVSAVSLVSGGLGIASTATGIASLATMKSNPGASSILGWTSFATGIASTVGAAGQGIFKQAVKYRANQAPRSLPQRAGAFRRVSTTDRIFASDSPVSAYTLIDSIASVRKVDPGRPITILAGTHGNPRGEIWIRPASRLTSEIRIDPYYYDSGILSISKSISKTLKRTTVVDITTLTAEQYNQLLNDDSIKFLLYCFSRNDTVLRATYALEPVSVIESLPNEFKWSNEKIRRWLIKNRRYLSNNESTV